MHYFKNWKYIGSCNNNSNIIFEWYDLVIDSLDKEQIKLLKLWYVYVDWKIVEPTKTDEQLKEEKKQEARKIIESRYKIHDQVNILARWTQEEIDDMNSYIDWILNEYRTNWKDADFSSFKK